MGRRLPPSSRRLLAISIVLGTFVLLDLGLFGWLIFRSLSKREVERVLLETRQEAEGLARQLVGRAAEGEGNLYTITAMEREMQNYIDSILKQREFVQSVEVRDAEGKLVFRASGEVTVDLDPEKAQSLEVPEMAAQVEHGPFTSEEKVTLDKPPDSLYELDVPIGQLGFLHIGISRGELQKRVEVLRTELVRNTALVGLISLVVLLLAYFIIYRLWRRAQRLEETAAEAERMAYIGTLASGLAHEIRNPLNSLNLNMQLLEEEMGGTAPGSSAKLMALTRDEMGRLERLVTDFLCYAKPRPLDLEEVPAVELLARCRELLAGEIQSVGARVEVVDRSDGARVKVDRGQMGQLLINLVQNALAAFDGTGRTPEVELVAERSGGGQVVLAVKDQGVGIPPDRLGKIFDLFYSTRKGGTGLGLAVVERIARLHEGELSVQSVPGSGTTMRLTLPAVARARVDLAAESPVMEPTV